MIPWRPAVWWEYEPADWVVEPGLPDHHLRVVMRFVGGDLARWYLIFDTSPKDKWGDYRWRRADELESKSQLKARPNTDDVTAILERTEQCRFVAWSLPARTDCESIQRWIHSGDERDRWSPQLWITIGLGVVGAIALASQPGRRTSHRR